MMVKPIKMMATRKPSFLLALLLVLAVSVTLLAPGAEAKAPSEDEPTYDPNNEGMIEKGSRYIQRRFMSRTDEEITEGRFLAAAALHPKFHSSITVIKGIKSPQALEDILQMPPPPPRREGAERGFPWSVSRGNNGEERKVWVVLATAPEADVASRMIDTLYNKTVGFIKDGPDGDGTLLSNFLSTIQDAFAGTSEYAAAREDDEGRDEATSLERRREERALASQRRAKDYNFAVADFTHEPDLMWHWWIWKVPVILFITPSTSPERSYDIRFWKVSFTSGLDSEKILQYVGSDLWLNQLPIWDSSLAPGGSQSHLPLLLAKPANVVYDKFIKIPNWLVGILSTALGGTLIQLLHGMGGKKDTTKKKKKEEEEETKAKEAETAGAKSSSIAAGTSKATRRK